MQKNDLIKQSLDIPFNKEKINQNKMQLLNENFVLKKIDTKNETDLLLNNEWTSAPNLQQSLNELIKKVFLIII